MDSSWQHQQQQPLQQQLPQQGPQTILIPQPVVIRRGVPFLRRGVRFSNGCRCGTCCLSLICTFGCTILYLGIILVSVIGSRDSDYAKSVILAPGAIVLIVGVLLTTGGFYLCCLARKQFNALPEDHPERIKYSSGVAVPARGRHAYTTYEIPPGANVVTYPVSIGPGGQQNPVVLQPGQQGYPALVQGDGTVVPGATAGQWNPGHPGQSYPGQLYPGQSLGYPGASGYMQDPSPRQSPRHSPRHSPSPHSPQKPREDALPTYSEAVAQPPIDLGPNKQEFGFV